METMKAALLKGPSHFEIGQVPKPRITEPDEVLIKVLVCSICGTDVSVSGTMRYGSKDLLGEILGHELVGVIEEIGSAVTGLSVGQRVVVNPNCDTVYSLIQSLTSQIRHRMEDPKSSGKYFVFLGSENKNHYPIAVNILK